MANEAVMTEVVIGPDKLRAWVRVNAVGDREAYSEQNLRAALEAYEVVVDEGVQKRIAALAARVRAGEVPTEDVVLAEGVAAVNGKDGIVEWMPECDPAKQTASGEAGDMVNHYARSNIVSVSAGAVICTVAPPTEGQAGRNICGREIPQRKGRRVALQFGDSVEQDNNSHQVRAKIGGRLNVVQQRVWISPLLTVARNVDFQVGNVNFDGDVLVGGNVLDLFAVKCSRDLVVRGVIEAARIEVGGELVAGGGVAGKEKAVVTVGGGVKARFVDNATLTAGGDVFVQKEAVNAKIVTAGRVVTPGALTASTVEARNGVEAAMIGSATGQRTTVVVGYDRPTQRRLGQLEREMEELGERMKSDRAKLDSMLKRQATLPEGQRGRLTTLLVAVKEEMEKMAVMETEQKTLQETVKASREATIQVSRMIREGTTVQLGRAATTLKMSLQGPVRLMNRRVDGMERIAAAEGEGREVMLESAEV